MFSNQTVFLGAVVTVLLSVGFIPTIKGAPSRLQEPHVIGGVSTTIDKFPYQLSLERFWIHACGAGIISENHALTAAHCVDPREVGPQWALRLRAGSTIQFPIFNFFFGQIHHMKVIKIHPEYDAIRTDYDVAVIVVKNKFQFGPRVQPISIPTEDEDTFIDYKKPATISGWGLTKINGWFPPLFLKTAEIPLIPRDDCDFFEYNNWVDFTPRMICGAGTGKNDTNTGDSGGPIVHKGQLIALVSWGLRIYDSHLPSVFTNLLDKEIRDFIKLQAGV